MKNVILGCIGTAITLYVTLMVLSLYTVYVQQNELDRVLSRVMWSTMNRCCSLSAAFDAATGEREQPDNASVRRHFTEEMTEAMRGQDQLGIRIIACDMQAGILSAEVSLRIPLPGGYEKTIRRSRTIIVDRPEVMP